MRRADLAHDAREIAKAMQHISQKPEDAREVLADLELSIRGPELAFRKAVPTKIAPEEKREYKYTIKTKMGTYEFTTTKKFPSKGLTELRGSRIATFDKELLKRKNESSITSIKLVHAGGKRELSPAERSEFIKDYHERFSEMLAEGRFRKPKDRIKIREVSA